MPGVSFVVPVRDRAALLERSLAAIRRAACDCEFEIVVVDDGSRDASREVALAAGATVVAAHGEPLGALRNRGAGVARGEVLIFVDADVLLAREWVATALDALAAGAGAVGAPSSAPADGNWVERTYDLLRRRVARRTTVRWVPSGAMAVRSDAFRAVGGFDPSLSSCEDVDLCRRLRAAGDRIWSDPVLVSVHCDDPRTLGALFLGEVRRGAANLRVSLRRHAAGEIPSLLVSVTVLALLLALGPAAAIAVAGRPRPLAGGLMLLGATCALRGAMMARAGGWRRLPAAMVVGAVYELGRAAGLLTGGLGRTRARRASP